MVYVLEIMGILPPESFLRHLWKASWLVTPCRTRKYLPIASHFRQNVIRNQLVNTNTFRAFLCLKSILQIYNKLFMSKNLKILPLLEEGKTDTNRHVVDTQGDRITFLRNILWKELAQKTIIYKTHLILKLCSVQR